MRSWDRFLVPKPFTRICVSWAQWTRVPADLAPEEFEPKRQELNAAIERARLRALDYFKKASDDRPARKGRSKECPARCRLRLRLFPRS